MIPKKDEWNLVLGVILALGAATIFGILPTLIKITYVEGNNAITASFLRATLSIPILLFILRRKKLAILPAKEEFIPAFFYMGFSSGITMVLLSLSYVYIPVGIATVLHFVYPVAVTILKRYLGGEARLGKKKIVALLFCSMGILMFLEPNNQLDVRGVVLALFSGITYAWHILTLEHRKIVPMHYFRVSFYLAISVSVISGVLGLATNSLSLSLPLTSLGIMAVVSWMSMVVAIPMFKEGVKRLGSFVCAILSTMEPISSLLCGVFFLNEALSVGKLIGCILVLCSICLVIPAQKQFSRSR